MSKIEAVDLFYVSMPVVEDISDGSQDALLVRVQSGGKVGWGEAEASPLPSIASWIAPMSHGFCHPIFTSVLGQKLDTPEDIRRINDTVKRRSLDILQTDHTLSGIDVRHYSSSPDAWASSFSTCIRRLHADRSCP